MQTQINQYTKELFKYFIKEEKKLQKQGLTVNPIVSEIASWYEKLRNAMEYRQDEVLLQSTILRIIKRRILLGGGKGVAGPLVRELIWARYLPDGSVTEDLIHASQDKIDTYLKLRRYIIDNKILKDGEATKLVYDLLSSDLENLLNPRPDREAMSNYIFHALHPNITLENETEDTLNIQLFIAIRRSYTKDNLALLRFNLFKQYFGGVTSDSFEKVSSGFSEAHSSIERAIEHPLRYKIANYVKRYIPPFLILEDIIRTQEGNIYTLLENEEEFSNVVISTCEKKYSGIASKVRRAIVRSVVFILISKVLFAFVIEGTYEKYAYGHIQWLTLGLNIIAPVSLMIIASFFITTPNRSNSLRILHAIRELMLSNEPRIGYSITFQDPSKKKNTLSDIIFAVLWFATFLISFGFIVFVLTKLDFNIVSQGIFLFFIAIVSFLSYRISQTAHIYTLEDKQSIKTLVADFFFLPVARVGMYLTEGISQVNIILFLFDFVIETPFKGLFGFFDQWFLYLHSKRENLE
ncbi:MAG: hypothetical protein KBC00_03475 [Candidatus Levybacteria bacterium]|nr:hypothetical protein [Candidatus Levybacteria bacterium]MBP9815127.1 hypothetical protein [Candidatus Levybacteria bacterium]